MLLLQQATPLIFCLNHIRFLLVKRIGKAGVKAIPGQRQGQVFQCNRRWPRPPAGVWELAELLPHAARGKGTAHSSSMESIHFSRRAPACLGFLPGIVLLILHPTGRETEAAPACEPEYPDVLSRLQCAGVIALQMLRPELGSRQDTGI